MGRKLGREEALEAAETAETEDVELLLEPPPADNTAGGGDVTSDVETGGCVGGVDILRPN